MLEAQRTRALGARTQQGLACAPIRRHDETWWYGRVYLEGDAAKRADKRGPVLIIVDPLVRFVRLRDANDYAEVTRALEPLLALARETGAHVLAVHHLGKGERSGGDAILGSTALLGAVDTALLLRRTDRYRTLSTIQRYGEDLEETVLTLEPETRVIVAGGSRRDAEEADAAAIILDYLGTLVEPVEESAIHKALDGRKAVKERALRQLVGQARVTRTGAGRKGDPYRYAILPPGSSPYTREGESENESIPATVALDSPSRGLGRENRSGPSLEGESSDRGREHPGAEEDWRP